jgi:hypothetical protein
LSLNGQSLSAWLSKLRQQQTGKRRSGFSAIRVLPTQNGLMTFGPCHGGLVILKLPVEFSNQAA